MKAPSLGLLIFKSFVYLNPNLTEYEDKPAGSYATAFYCSNNECPKNKIPGFGFYHAEQLNNEFYFSGYDRIAQGVIYSAAIPIQGALGGSVGNYIGKLVEVEGNVKVKVPFRMEIDHQNGRFIHISRVACGADGYPDF